MAGLFGDIMAEIFAWEPDAWELSLRKIGFFLGKFIYLMDAYEDVEKDIGNNSYNPLKEAFCKKLQNSLATECRTLLTMMMAECSREFEQLPILLHADILRNILYSGVCAGILWLRPNDMKTRIRRTIMNDPYSVLGISRGATDDEIKKAYRH